jgi:hypothetical protein
MKWVKTKKRGQWLSCGAQAQQTTLVITSPGLISAASSAGRFSTHLLRQPAQQASMHADARLLLHRPPGRAPRPTHANNSPTRPAVVALSSARHACMHATQTPCPCPCPCPHVRQVISCDSHASDKATNPTKSTLFCCVWVHRCMLVAGRSRWWQPLPVACLSSLVIFPALLSKARLLCVLEPLFISVVSFSFWVSFFNKFPKDAGKQGVVTGDRDTYVRI